MNCICVCFTLTRREPFAWKCRGVKKKTRDLDATVYNLLLLTVLMLQNVRGALFIFSVPKKVDNEWDHTKSRTCWLPFQVKYLNLMRQAAMHFWAVCTDKQMLSPRRQVNMCAFVIREIKHSRTCSWCNLLWLTCIQMLIDKTTTVFIFLLCHAALHNPLFPKTIVVTKMYCMTMHLRMKPKGNYWEGEEPFVCPNKSSSSKLF